MSLFRFTFLSNLKSERRRIKSFLNGFPLSISEHVIISQIRIVTTCFGDYNVNTCDFKLQKLTINKLKAPL